MEHLIGLESGLSTRATLWITKNMLARPRTCLALSFFQIPTPKNQLIKSDLQLQQLLNSTLLKRILFRLYFFFGKKYKLDHFLNHHFIVCDPLPNVWFFKKYIHVVDTTLVCTLLGQHSSFSCPNTNEFTITSNSFNYW